MSKSTNCLPGIAYHTDLAFPGSNSLRAFAGVCTFFYCGPHDRHPQGKKMLPARRKNAPWPNTDN